MKTRYSSKTISNAPGRAHNLLKNAVAMANSDRHNRKNGVSTRKVFGYSSG